MKSTFTHIGNLGGSSRTFSVWLILLLVTSLAVAVLSSVAMPETALAQDDGIDDPVDEFGDDEGLGDEKAGDEKAAPASDETEKSKNKTMLGWMFRSLGITYSVIFFGLSVTFVSFLVTNIIGLRRESVLPTNLIMNFEAELKEKRYQEAYQLAKGDESFLGQVLSAGLAKLQFGYDHAVESMQEASEDENMRLEHRLSYISLIGNISPMVGLMGTVQGMIASFQVIANAGTNPKASDLAEGISTALFTTLIGLMIAIPAIAAFSILRNRAARLVLEAGIASEDLMSRFQSPNK